MIAEKLKFFATLLIVLEFARYIIILLCNYGLTKLFSNLLKFSVSS